MVRKISRENYLHPVYRIAVKCWLQTAKTEFYTYTNQFNLKNILHVTFQWILFKHTTVIILMTIIKNWLKPLLLNKWTLIKYERKMNFILCSHKHNRKFQYSDRYIILRDMNIQLNYMMFASGVNWKVNSGMAISPSKICMWYLTLFAWWITNSAYKPALYPGIARTHFFFLLHA